MFSRAIHAVVYPVERAFYSVEMAIAAVRRYLISDVGTVLSGFDRMVADLEAFAAREVAANQRDQKKLNDLYDRIDARRSSVGRATAAASNIKKLTASN